MCDHRVTQRWPRPGWRALYAMVGVAAMATAITRAVLPASLLRSAVLIALPVMAGVALVLWVATNRVALDLSDWCDCAGSVVRVRVIGAAAPPPRSSVRAARTVRVERTTLRG